MSKEDPKPGAPWELVLRPKRGGAAAVVMVFRWIPAGEFIMGQRGEQGDEEPRHRVEINRGFWLAETPVTQAQYRVWKPDHRNRFEGDDCPAEQVTWYDAVLYCDWLTEGLAPVLHSHLEAHGANEGGRARLSQRAATPFRTMLGRLIWLALPKPKVKAPDPIDVSGHEASGLGAGEPQMAERWAATLPTEAQWEYACRGGVGRTEYYSGNGEGALREVGWFEGNSGSRTHPVKGLKPNRWNLYDLHGNVYEWCADEYRDEAYRMREDGVKNPGWEDQEMLLSGKASEAAKDRIRVLRGGSWVDTAVRCRAAYRNRRRPGVDGVIGDYGFRPCLVPLSGGPSRKSSQGKVGAGAGRRSDEGRGAESDEAGGDLAKFHVRADPRKFLNEDS